MTRLLTPILLAAVCTSRLVDVSASDEDAACDDDHALLQLSTSATTQQVHEVIAHPPKDWHACNDSIPVNGVNGSTPMPARGIITCCAFDSAYMDSQSAASTLIRRYLSFGGRLIDTAPMYGVTESAVGPAVRASGIPRATLWLQSKIETITWNPSKGPAKDWALAQLDKTLGVIGVSYMDSMVLHMGVADATLRAATTQGSEYTLKREDMVEMWRALIDAKRKGKVHHIGVCETTQDEIEYLLRETGEVPAIALVWWHPWMPKEQKTFIDWLKSKAIAVQAYGLFNDVAQDPVKLSAAKSAALRHDVTWGQFIIQSALDMGIGFTTSYNGGYWEEDLKCLGFHPDAKDHQILAVAPEWQCSTGIAQGQNIAGCGQPSKEELLNEHGLQKTTSSIQVSQRISTEVSTTVSPKVSPTSQVSTTEAQTKEVKDITNDSKIAEQNSAGERTMQRTSELVAVGIIAVTGCLTRF